MIGALQTGGARAEPLVESASIVLEPSSSFQLEPKSVET